LMRDESRVRRIYLDSVARVNSSCVTVR